MKRKTILSLDASTTCTGWAIWNEKGLAAYGAIKPDGEGWRDRLVHEGAELKDIIEQYRPSLIVMEDVPLNSKGGLKTLVVLGGVQGFILGVASACHVPIQLILPNQWRSKIGLYDGTEAGKKRDVLKEKAVRYVNSEFGLSLNWVSPSSKKNQDDIAEAILIGYSYMSHK